MRQIAADKPDLVLITGDLVYVGSNAADWRQFDRVVLVLDGQESTDLAAGDEVHVRLDKGGVRVVHNPDLPFLLSLQKKLGWQGSRKRSL